MRFELFDCKFLCGINNRVERVAVVIGEPIYVESTDDNVVEAARQVLESSLTYLERLARRALAPEKESSD